ncbi:hypothetical protein PFLUV_G00061040 [Perca fluviatilis]|uniref:Uncharacterized protein n=1 Tax=Perca fluviatilis TaxID=8168 RepID=A0A6A5FAB2_PERFL|nr:hypothetical protein PFLUV_G00061040 [Perca fluviatilis]
MCVTVPATRWPAVVSAAQIYQDGRQNQKRYQIGFIIKDTISSGISCQSFCSRRLCRNSLWFHRLGYLCSPNLQMSPKRLTSGVLAAPPPTRIPESTQPKNFYRPALTQPRQCFFQVNTKHNLPSDFCRDTTFIVRLFWIDDGSFTG